MYYSKSSLYCPDNFHDEFNTGRNFQVKKAIFAWPGPTLFLRRMSLFLYQHYPTIKIMQGIHCGIATLMITFRHLHSNEVQFLTNLD